MSDVRYLTDEGKEIVEVRRTVQPRYGRTVNGYSTRRGAPLWLQVCLAGENRWRRVYVWQFSNSGTLFVRIKGEPYVIRNHELPEVRE